MGRLDWLTCDREQVNEMALAAAEPGVETTRPLGDLYEAGWIDKMAELGRGLRLICTTA
jgi:hypothetical protein